MLPPEIMHTIGPSAAMSVMASDSSLCKRKDLASFQRVRAAIASSYRDHAIVFLWDAVLFRFSKRG
jgi:hypothetical protein